MGEKQEESSSSSSSEDEDEVVKSRPAQDGAQGLESAEIVLGGGKVQSDKPLTEKEKKKLQQKEAKKKRDEMVSKMTKATEVGLGEFADLTERLTK